MSQYEVVLEGRIYPLVTGLSLGDAENVEIATLAATGIRERSLSAAQARSRKNPAGDEVAEIESEIHGILGHVPETKKNAVKSADKSRKSEIANLYDRLAVKRVEFFGESLADSIRGTMDSQFDVLINEGVVAQLICARFQDFNAVAVDTGRARFEDLSQRDQDYILNIMMFLDLFFDISKTSSVADFTVEAFVNTLAKFQGRKVIKRVTDLLSVGMREDAQRVPVHYAAPYLQAVYLGSQARPGLGWFADPSMDHSFDTPFQIFIGDHDNQGLDAKSVEAICETLQANTLLAGGTKLALALAQTRADSNLFYESNVVEKIVLATNIMSSEDFRAIRNKSHIIALCAIAISSSVSYDTIIANNFGAVRSAQSALKGILRLVGGVSSTPETALRYARVDIMQGEFDDYLHWCASLIGAYTESKTFNDELWKSSRDRLKMLLDDKSLRRSVSALISEIRKSRKVGNPKIPRIQQNKGQWAHPLDFRLGTHISDLDNCGYYGNPFEPISAKFRNYCESAGHSRAFKFVFPEEEFSFKDALQVLFAGSLAVGSFESVDPREVEFRLLGSSNSDMPVYMSRRLNPLSLVIGHNDFWNCCFTMWREATSSAVAAYFTGSVGAIVGFAKGVPNFKNYDVITTYMTSYQTVKLNYFVSQPIADRGMSLTRGEERMSLRVLGSLVSDLEEGREVRALALGGSEVSIYVKDRTFASSDLCRGRFAEAVMDSPSITRELSTINIGGNLGSAFSDLSVYAENVGMDCEISDFQPTVDVYGEVGETNPSAAMCGVAEVTDASGWFSKVEVAFAQNGGDARVTYFDLRGDRVGSVDADWDTLMYMFAVPTAKGFIPFKGSVHFETSPENRGLCEDLILPSGFKSADEKPFVKDGRTFRSRDLIQMRTPRRGVYVSGERVL